MPERQTANSFFKDVIALFNCWSNVSNNNNRSLVTTDSDTKIKLQIWLCYNLKRFLAKIGVITYVPIAEKNESIIITIALKNI